MVERPGRQRQPRNPWPRHTWPNLRPEHVIPRADNLGLARQLNLEPIQSRASDSSTVDNRRMTMNVVIVSSFTFIVFVLSYLLFEISPPLNNLKQETKNQHHEGDKISEDYTFLLVQPLAILFFFSSSIPLLIVIFEFLLKTKLSFDRIIIHMMTTTTTMMIVVMLVTAVKKWFL